MLTLLILSLATPERPEPRPSNHEIQEMLVGDRVHRSSSGIRLQDAVIRNTNCTASPLHPEDDSNDKNAFLNLSRTAQSAVECRYDAVWVPTNTPRSKRLAYQSPKKQRVLSRKEKKAILPNQWQAETHRFLYVAERPCALRGHISKGMDCATRYMWVLAKQG